MQMLAYVVSDAPGAVNGTLTGVASALRDRNVAVVGTTQADVPRARGPGCDMDLTIWPSGHVIRISQDLGRAARGCKLDPEALETAVASAQNVLDDGAVLIVNKFGKHEAEGRGFREVIADGLGRGLPVVVGANARNLDAFLAFCGGEVDALPADVAAVLEWIDARM